jgi:hypothetical protein
VNTGPIYIIGTERSGSNLLRVILNTHSRISIPHPPHIMRYFSALTTGYGDLVDPDALGRLTDDVLHLIATHIYPWEVVIDRDQVVAEARPKSLLGVFAAIQDQHLASTGKARWGCKSTFMVHHVDEAIERDPGARFIWLVRDPRDVAVSSRKSVFSPYHPMHTAALWVAQQAEALALEERLGSAMLRLRYEDLIADPDTEIRQVCRFLDEAFEPALLEYDLTRAARKGAGLSESWQNTGRPLLRHNAGKYKTGLTDAELASVEAVAGECMDALGYTRDIDPPPGMPTGWDRTRFSAQGWWWRFGVEARSLHRDNNHWRRWRRAALMTYLGVRRGGRQG